MLNQIKGLHHVTSLASDARINNDFFTHVLGLRRVKKTVNFDAPDVYHLYYGDAAGSPGTVMTYFPFPHAARGRPGGGEVATAVFSVPVGSLAFWHQRLAARGIGGLEIDEAFGERRLRFSGPDGDGFALIEISDDQREPWQHGGVATEFAIRGFHSSVLRLNSDAEMGELLQFMGYQRLDTHDGVTRFAVAGGSDATIIDIEANPRLAPAVQGAGSVHHLAFAVKDRAAQLSVRKALLDTGYQVTPVIDRDYFWAIYFRTPGGVLFEIATNEPGFDHDEDSANLGQALKLPARHEHLRAKLEKTLAPIKD